MAYFYIHEPSDFLEELDEDFLDESVDHCLVETCSTRWAMRWELAQQEVLDAEAEEKAALAELDEAASQNDRSTANFKLREAILRVNTARNALFGLAFEQRQSYKEAAEYRLFVKTGAKKAGLVKEKAKQEFEQMINQKRTTAIAKNIMERSNQQKTKPRRFSSIKDFVHLVKLDQGTSGTSTTGLPTPGSHVLTFSEQATGQSTPRKSSTGTATPGSNVSTPTTAQSTSGRNSTTGPSTPKSIMSTPTTGQSTPGRSSTTDPSTPKSSISTPTTGQNTPRQNKPS